VLSNADTRKTYDMTGGNVSGDSDNEDVEEDYDNFPVAQVISKEQSRGRRISERLGEDLA
jgi:hypothetical protein